MERARLAGPADVPRVAELARAAIAELAPTRGGAVWKAREARPEPLEENLTAALADPCVRVLAGTIDDVIVGYGTVRTESLRDGTVLGVVDEVFVEEGARAVGVGEGIMDQLLEWCRAEGCAGVDALALPGIRATKNFFEESGFSARLLVMHHRIALT